MESEPAKPVAQHPDEPAPENGVPPTLIHQLHDANEKFSRARQHLEEAFGAEVNPLTERDRATAEVHDAELEIEKIEQQIENKLQPQPAEEQQNSDKQAPAKDVSAPRSS
jgi:hypothetical protein